MCGRQVGALGGIWKLVYTQSPLSALLALGRLPFVTVGDITQTINPATGTVVNKVRARRAAWTLISSSDHN